MKTKVILLVLPLLAACSFGLYWMVKSKAVSPPSQPVSPKRILKYQPVKFGDTSGMLAVTGALQPIKDPASLESIRAAFEGLDRRGIADIDQRLA